MSHLDGTDWKGCLVRRLKKNGLISVQNPVEKAVQEGRFEELPDDYEEENERK